MAAWSYGFAVSLGAGHAQANSECQDAADCRVVDSAGEKVLVAVAADGAGSAPRSAEGARLACQVALEQARRWLENGGEIRGFNHAIAKDWLDALAEEAASLARREGRSVRDFASTLLVAVCGPNAAAFLQVGDGVIVFDADEAPECAFWPQKGEYENATWFATEPGSAEAAEVKVLERGLRRLAVMTDGLERLALDFTARRPYEPFFRGVFDPSRFNAENQDVELCQALASFLDSDRVNTRTADDKTLILASHFPLGFPVPVEASNRSCSESAASMSEASETAAP